MQKMEAGVKPYFEWVKENMPKGAVVGVDEDQIPAASFAARKEYFEKAGIQLVTAGDS